VKTEERREKREGRDEKGVQSSEFISSEAACAESTNHSSLFALHPSVSSPSGFTLIELLGVFIIIGVLAGMILGITKYASTNAATSRAKAEIAAMETALEVYRSDNGIYPITVGPRPYSTPTLFNTNSVSLYNALATGSRMYFTFRLDQLQVIGASPAITNVLDPFGNQYSYYCNPGAIDQTNQVTFDLWSFGPDHLNDTADDIVNWRH
jgi:type II secretory pathway pseudopilin PulG